MMLTKLVELLGVLPMAVPTPAPDALGDTFWTLRKIQHLQ